jgi:hypothetical protein
MNTETQENIKDAICSFDIYFTLNDTIDILNISTNDMEYMKRVKTGKVNLHLFRYSFKTQKMEWQESYNAKSKKCDIAMEFTDETLARLASISLEKNLSVNEVVVNLLREYIKDQGGNNVKNTKKRTVQKANAKGEKVSVKK